MVLSCTNIDNREIYEVIKSGYTTSSVNKANRLVVGHILALGAPKFHYWTKTAPLLDKDFALH